jgi:hypothetical protein
MWSFHIAKFRAGATAFDDKFDTPLNLAEAGLRVFCESPPGPVQIQEGALLSIEGGTIHFVHGQTTMKVVFPRRVRAGELPVVAIPDSVV